MKINKLLLSAGIITSMMSLGSCVGDLNLTPTDPSSITPGTFADDPSKYLEEAMAGVYFQFATYGANGNAAVQGFDGGMSTFQRAMFILEEVPSDEASWIPNDADYGLLQFGITPAANTAVMGMYSRLMINITLCSQFIQTVNDGSFNLNTAALQAEAEEFIRQARILRAATYWYAIDNFGNVPYIDESIPMGEIAPQLSTDFATGRRLVYQKNVDELESIVEWYKQNDPNNKPPYGYVGLDVAEAMLVKYYLNAEVYTGTPAWDKCLAHAESIIQRLGKGGFQNAGLCNYYLQLFGANNAQYAIGGASDINEIIWTIPQSLVSDETGAGLLSYANSTFMCNAWIGDSSKTATFKCALSDYNSDDGWKCIVARQQFVEKFEWDDETMGTSKDQRVDMWKTSADGFNIQNTSLVQSGWGNNGYLAVKYTNWNYEDDGSLSADQPTKTKQLGGDYAMVRLAEIYLSAAEAALHGAGSQSQALIYVNYLRERAGLDPITAINLVDLQDERCRELYTEATRRSDLIRYGQWISGYTWSWKNNVMEGHDFASNFNVYPIPSTVVSRNGYTQNPGY